MRRAAPLAASIGAVAAVIVPYVALGGATYAPTPLADPCQTRTWRDPDGLSEAIEQVALSGLDGAACELGVSREDLVLALRSEEALDDFAGERGVTRDDAEEAVQQGLLRALEDAGEAGSIPPVVIGLAKRIVETVPAHLLLEALEQLGGFLPG